MTEQQQKLRRAYMDAFDSKGDKVLDVTDLTSEGKGFRTIKVPKSDRGTKKGIAGLPVVSDNYTTFTYAMMLLGEHFHPFAEQYASMYGFGKHVRGPAAGPKSAASPKQHKIVGYPPQSMFVPQSDIGTNAKGVLVIKSPKALFVPSVPHMKPASPPKLAFKPHGPVIPVMPTHHFTLPQARPLVPSMPKSPFELPTVQTPPKSPSKSPLRLPSVQTPPKSASKSPLRLPSVQTPPKSASKSPLRLPTVQTPPKSPFKLPTVQTSPKAPFKLPSPTMAPFKLPSPGK